MLDPISILYLDSNFAFRFLLLLFHGSIMCGFILSRLEMKCLVKKGIHHESSYLLRLAENRISSEVEAPESLMAFKLKWKESINEEQIFRLFSNILMINSCLDCGHQIS